jgi:pimeloyl-ACP methyl ester carboxylesterase
MPQVERPDGARIYYEVAGSGYPLLLFAPGSISSQVSLWELSPLSPYDYGDEFMLIGMNQRNAAHSPGPLAAPTWEIHAADQRAVLDALGVACCHLWGASIGAPYALKFIEQYPDRVSAAICQWVVGLSDGVNTRATFFEPSLRLTVELARTGGMAAVVEAALENPVWGYNRKAGPFSERIAADAAFRAEVLALDPTAYERLLRAYDDQIWGAHGTYMSVEEEFVRRCPVPLLVLPGDDDHHPAAVAERLCVEAPVATCLGIDWSSAEKIAETNEHIRAFLRRHRPSAHAGGA